MYSFCVRVCLLSLRTIILKFIHVALNAVYFSVLINRIPMHTHMYTHGYIYLCMYYVYHNLFMHSVVDRSVNCSQFFFITVNKAASVQLFQWTYAFFLDKNLGVEQRG